jgi:hypothetical protein
MYITNLTDLSTNWVRVGLGWCGQFNLEREIYFAQVLVKPILTYYSEDLAKNGRTNSIHIEIQTP